jgi:outer membrane lipoprotein-sorting protein
MSHPTLHRATLTVGIALAVGTAAAQTVDQVVARYLEARGGLARLRSVQSLRLTGTMALPGIEAETPFVLELKRPRKMRTEFAVEGGRVVRAYDGQTAWMILPLPGEDARPMSPEDAAEARAQADVDFSPLVDAAAKGFTVELAGREPLPGGDTWKLVVRGKESPPRTMYLDVKTHLVVRIEDERTVEGHDVELVTEVGDYRSVGGLFFPYRIDITPKDKPDRQRLTIRTIEINPPLDDARFAMPASPTQPAKPPTGPSPSVLR